MTGKELHNILRANEINFNELATKLGLTPQSLNSRFKTKEISVKFLTEVSEAINKNLYTFIEKATQVNEPMAEYTPKKKYIEEQIKDLEERVKKLEDKK